MTPYPALLAAALATLGLAAPALAASPVKGAAHFLVLDAKEAPLAGAVVSGTCKSSQGPFWNKEQIETAWSCTTDADGACTAEITTLAKADGKLAECRGSVPSTIAELGASPAQSSYFAFFAKGDPYSYNLLKKGASWKHGDYVFQSFPGKEAFESVAYRFDSAYYQRRMSSQSGTLSTLPAHYVESKAYMNLAYLTAQRDPKAGTPTVQVEVAQTYIDFAYHRYVSAHFEGAGGAQTVALAKVGENMVCNMRDLFERKCTHQESVRFNLDWPTVRQLAAAHRPGVRSSWTLRIASATGQERTLTIAHAEFAALLAALEAPGGVTERK